MPLEVPQRPDIPGVKRVDHLHQFADVPSPIRRAAIRHKARDRREANQEVGLVGESLLETLADAFWGVRLDDHTWERRTVQVTSNSNKHECLLKRNIIGILYSLVLFM